MIAYTSEHLEGVTYYTILRNAHFPTLGKFIFIMYLLLQGYKTDMLLKRILKF